ncbi:MAG: IS200/IS605 family transposase [Candidatus Dormibacteria bacterium]
MGPVGYRSTNKTVYSAKYHDTAPQGQQKYRRRVLVGRVESRLKEIIGEVVAELGASIIEGEVMADHVHVLVEIPPTVALSRFVGLVKGRSSRFLRAEFAYLRRMPVLWSPSWFVSTVGGAPLEVVRRYVENQKAAA